jgi:hypothetical protein
VKSGTNPWSSLYFITSRIWIYPLSGTTHSLTLPRPPTNTHNDEQRNVHRIPQRHGKRQPNRPKRHVSMLPSIRSPPFSNPHHRIQERIEFEEYDLVCPLCPFFLSSLFPYASHHQSQKNGIRATLVQALKDNFPDYGLTYSIGGQISFDVFPHGWDKTFALERVADEEFEEIHFFGDKTYKASWSPLS